MIPGTDRRKASFHLGETPIEGVSPAGAAVTAGATSQPQPAQQTLDNETPDNNGAPQETN